MKSIKVNSWLPVFSGFYGTIWDNDSMAEMELYNINEDRRAKGLRELEDDSNIEWDYAGYYKAVAESVASEVGYKLKELGYVAGMKFQKLHSPREYNFANDAIHVQFTLTQKTITAVGNYLVEHQALFAQYLRERYTSYDGFMSFHSNEMDAWMLDVRATMTDEHKCGAVLNFILLLEEGERYEEDLYEYITGNGVMLCAKNYAELIAA